MKSVSWQREKRRGVIASRRLAISSSKSNIMAAANIISIMAYNSGIGMA